ncbi:hypothetical protein ES703_40100 [subsurface metagenome]
MGPKAPPEFSNGIYAAEAFLKKLRILELSLTFLSTILKIRSLLNLYEVAQVLGKPLDNLLRVIKSKCLQI